MELPVRSPDSGGRKTPLSSSSYTIETRNLSYKSIIKDANCEAKTGEITAIAGPSGAGKTTLLEILAGKIKVSSGSVLVNGSPINPKSFRRLSGYVSQEDALFPLLTVEETLMFSALLRNRGGKTEARNRVLVLIKDLGLERVLGSRVGEGSNRGISGGEKRRVSIGVELVHDPAVILLDEPTSGLDSCSAFEVVSMLKRIVSSHEKTVVLTIHQPGFRILELLDRLVLLSNGLVLHNGSLESLEKNLCLSGLRVPPRVNILEFAIDFANQISIQTTELTSPTHCRTREIKKKGMWRLGNNYIRLSDSVSPEKCRDYSNSRLDEVLILGERFCKNVLRTRELFATRIIQALLAGFILGSIFINSENKGNMMLQTRLGFFAFSLTFLLSSMVEGLPIFLQERRILMRETSSGAYRVSSYVISNTIVFLPFLAMVGLLFTIPVYWLVQLRPEPDRFLYFALVVWLVVLMSNSFTACLSALVPDFIMGTSVIAGLMGSFFLFSGYFIAKDDIPPYWIFMHYLSLFKYPFECFLINEYGGQFGDKCVEFDGSSRECKMNGNEFLAKQQLVESQKWSNLGVMVCFVVGYRLLCFGILWFRCYRSNRC